MPRKRAAPKRKVKKQKEDVACGEADAPGISKQAKKERLESLLSDFQDEMEQRQTWLRKSFEEEISALTMFLDIELLKYPERLRKMKVTDFFAQLKTDTTNKEKQNIPTVTAQAVDAKEENKENVSDQNKKQTVAASGSKKPSETTAMATPAPTGLSDLISTLNIAAQQRHRMASVAEDEEDLTATLPVLSETDMERLKNHLASCSDTLDLWVAKSTQARNRRVRKIRH